MQELLSSHRLGDYLAGRNNNLNLIRMIAASAVLISHAYPIALGPGTPEPFENLTRMTLGGIAVAIFFALSGLLIARSFDRKKTLVHFAAARIMRLFPALLVVLALTVLAGAALTDLSLQAYFLSPETLSYIPRNLSLAFLQYPLPGVFDTNAYGDPINGSLWTLFYEVVCYLGVVCVGLIGLLRRRVLFSLAFAALTAGYLYALHWEPQSGIAMRLDLLMILGFPFGLGMMAYVWRDKFTLDLRFAAVLWALCVPAAHTPFLPAFVLVALIYSVAWFGFIPKGALLNYNRLGDYSYGMYIFAFPIQQMFAHLVPQADPLGNMAFAFPLTLVCAIASWHLVENAALAKVHPLADRITKRLGLEARSQRPGESRQA
ncbi:MAG: acyltransferase [Pseudomonadota bacterium]